MKYSPENIGNVVRFHRKRSGLSRNDLATLAGVGKTVLFDVEHGKSTVKLETLMKIFSALNISLRLESPLMEEYEKR